MTQPGRNIALIGNPNCGKTTLFNALTGARQQVGNWPGVTVERKVGQLRLGGDELTLVDLPGVYALDRIPGVTSLDEQVAHDYLLGGETDLIINILDASNLERNLYLTTQLLELGQPMLVALNMLDAAHDKGLTLDPDALSRQLGCPVVAMSASRGEGIEALRAQLARAVPPPATRRVIYPEALNEAITELVEVLTPTPLSLPPAWVALHLLEGDAGAEALVDASTRVRATALRRRVEQRTGEEIDILTADARYRLIEALIPEVAAQRVLAREQISRRIDQLVLHRLLGLPIFLATIYLMFLFTINLGGAFIDLFDQLFAALLVDGLAQALAAIGSPDWLTLLLADGVGGGIQTLATFIPVIGFLFLFLSFLEDSGYMARAAFVMDRLMRALGLPGKSFVPLIVGFGCNVPAVMATRTLENPRDRLLTMAMTPFMSCGARLPVYALFAAAFFPVGGQNMVFLLYLVGVAVAVLTALALRRTLLPGEAAPFVMELPPYHLPTPRALLLHSWSRLKGFTVKAGLVIVPMVLVLNLLNGIGSDGRIGQAEGEQTLLASIGRTIAPAFAPIGLSEENWPAAVGVFTGILAKEAVVGTLNTLYARPDPSASAEDQAPWDLTEAVAAAFASVPENLAGLADAALDPLGLNIGDSSDQSSAASNLGVDASAFGTMVLLFDGTAGAFAYLLLILLYFPCVAVLGAVYREAGAPWAGFIALWSTGLGYGIATLYYQLATLASHPAQSIAWSLAVLLTLGAGLYSMRRWGQRQPATPRLASETI